MTTFRIGHTLPRGSTVASAQLDGRPIAPQRRGTNRGLEVWVQASPAERHRSS